MVLVGRGANIPPPPPPPPPAPPKPIILFSLLAFKKTETLLPFLPLSLLSLSHPHHTSPHTITKTSRKNKKD
jgi:hypothetical protein